MRALIILLLLLTGCMKEIEIAPVEQQKVVTETQIETIVIPIVTTETEVIEVPVIVTETVYVNPEEDVSWQHIYNMGKSHLILLEDEDGKIDILASYLYADNPTDGTLEKFYLTATNLRIVDESIRYRQTVTSTQLNTYFWNVQKDDGGNLKSETHYLSVDISFNAESVLLEVSIQVFDEDGDLVVDRLFTEEE